MMKRVGIIVFLLIGIRVLANADSKALDYWKTTNLSFNIVEEHYINDKNCLRDERRFLGCIEALNYLARWQSEKEPVIVLSSRHLVNENDVLDRVGDFVIAKDRQALDAQSQKTKDYEKYRTRKQFEKMWGETWLEVFKLRKKSQLPIVRVYQYLVQRVDANLEPMVAGSAVNAYLASAVDPHTQLSPSIELSEKYESADQNYVGIGVILTKNEDGYLKILEVVDGGPADQAGLKTRDIIVKIDDKELQNLSQDDSLELVRGKEGSRVLLTVRRGSQKLELEVRRAPVKVANVRVKTVDLFGSNKAGYIKVRQFAGKTTCAEFSSALLGFQGNPDVKGLVVDLRGNPGGLVSTVSCMLDAFLPKGKIVLSVHDPVTNAMKDAELTRDDYVIFNKSLVVLVDGYSASASEVFAGAVQDHQLGFVVGARTFGKGTVQRVRSYLVYHGVSISETIGRFHLPSGRTNQLVGVSPDFEAYASPQPTEEEKFFAREEDLYRYVIRSAQTERRVFHPRYGEVRMCLNVSRPNQKRYAADDDFPLLVALDVIECDTVTQGLAQMSR